MQFRVFYVPVTDSTHAEAEMNSFLRGQRIISVRKDLLQEGNAWAWIFLVEFIPAVSGQKSFSSKETVDYRNILTPSDFSFYLKLKEMRKKLAEDKAVPVFTIFTNEQLAEISRKRPASFAALQACDGIGEARVRDFGQHVLDTIKALNPGA